MSSLRIEEQLELEAPAERVWAWLVDPERVVSCLPGATIDATEGERTYRGSMKVKIGPVSMTYQGVAEFVEVDADRRTMRLEGKGSDKGGGGQVQMVMASRVESVTASRSRILVDVDVKLAGKMVRFGRGMIGVVSERLFQEFAQCLAARVGEEAATAVPPEPDGASKPDVAARSRAPERELGALGLLFRALWSWLARLFSRSG